MIVVAGLSHRSAPVALLDRLAIGGDALPDALRALRRDGRVHECVILSTCNRVEIYARASDAAVGRAALVRFLSERSRLPAAELGRSLYTSTGEEAVGHLFAVASGIDSMVIGEPQILAQVRRAYGAALAEGAAGGVLGTAFRRAIEVGRRVRAETGISRTAESFAEAAARLAARSLCGLAGRTALVAGSGTMGELAVGALARRGARIVVANRTPERALALAGRAGGEAVPMDDLAGALARADLMVAATGSPGPIIERDMVCRAMSTRPDRPLMIVDLGVPRDVEPAAGSVAGVALYGLDDLRAEIVPSPAQVREVERVRAIVAEEVSRFELRGEPGEKGA